MVVEADVKFDPEMYPDLDVIGTRWALPRDRTPDDPLARRAIELLLGRIADRTLRALMHYLAGPYRYGAIDDLALLAGFNRRDIDLAHADAGLGAADLPMKEQVLVALVRNDIKKETHDG